MGCVQRRLPLAASVRLAKARRLCERRAVSEPKERASRITRVAPDIVRWSVHQSRIGGYPGESYAVQTRGGIVLIDPLPLEDAALKKLTALGPVIAIALTIQSHQRASWRYARLFVVKVYAPRGAQGLDEKPDASYRAGAKLPGGLTAIALPGPAFSEHGFSWRSSAGRALFCSDLLTHAAGRLAFVSDEYMDAPDLARKSARRLLDLKIDLLCPGHGAPLIGDVRREIAALLARDRR